MPGAVHFRMRMQQSAVKPWLRLQKSLLMLGVRLNRSRATVLQINLGPSNFQKAEQLGRQFRHDDGAILAGRHAVVNPHQDRPTVRAVRHVDK